ncbi:MAG TPA: nucleoside monophosphate kinase, partial [Dehalococcoidia bacterium]|nr:nucleoside monophosphate kinase [Dehalococcoidia bacterium]
ELGLKVKNYIENGALVPDEITGQVVLERMSSSDCLDGVIFDGFPRNLKQAGVLDEALKKLNKQIDWVVYIKVPEKTLIKRLGKRLVCRNCQTPYSVEAAGKRSKCEKCGGELYQRPDDNIETAKERLKVYFNKTAPLIEYYRKGGKLLEIDGEGDIDNITSRIVAALRERACIAK